MMQELPDDMVERLSRVTKLLATQRTLPATLETIVAIVKRLVPNCDAAGICLLVEEEPMSGAVTERLTVEVDLVQYQTGQGPCLAAIADEHIVRIDMLDQDSRFTRFAPGALALDIHSVLSMPLDVRGRTVGAMNLYSHQSNAFDDSTAAMVQPLADHAAIAISTSPLYAYSIDMVDGLVETVENRAVIEQAIGVIMETEAASHEEGLDRLRDLALQSGKPMRTIADWILDERPTRGARPPDERPPTGASPPDEGRGSGVSR